MRVGILGPLEVWEDGRPLELGAGRQRALLALLVLHADEVVSSDRLIEELWNGDAPATAAKVVQGYVSQLRKALPPDVLVTRPPGYVLRVDDTDAAEFARLLEGSQCQQPAEAARTLSRALALWRGRPLADVEYESWAQTEIARLDDLRLAALEDRIEAGLQLGRHARLVPELEALVAEHPLRERVRAQLLLALYRSGRQAEALEGYADGRRRLVEELGIEPGPELQALQRRILAQDPELGPVARPRPLVTHRRAWGLVLLGALLVAGAIAAAVVELTGGGSSAVGASSVALLDPASGARRSTVHVAATRLALGGGSVWALDGDSGTISQLDAGTHRLLSTFSVGARPVDLAADATALWVLDGGDAPQTGASGKTQPAAVIEVDPQSRGVLRRISLPPGDSNGVVLQQFHLPQLALAGGSLWVPGPDGSLFRLDERSGRLARVGAVHAVGAVAAGDGALWAESFDALQPLVSRLDPRTGRPTLSFRVPVTAETSFVAGAGAVWIADEYTGSILRVTPGSPPVVRSVPVGVGATQVAAAGGTVWAGNDFRDALIRIDASGAGITRTVFVPSPQAIDVTSRGVLVASGLGAGGAQLPRSACGSVVYGGSGSPRFLIASDLALRGDSIAVNVAMARAVAWVLRRDGYRAGRYTVGYQSCDDSSPQSGSFDNAKCVANGKLYARTPRVLGVVGTYNSGCAGEMLPELNEAPDGPVALVSPLNTYDILTRAIPGQPADSVRHLYPTGVRNYARVIGPDAVEVAADAVLAKELRLRRVAVLDDRDGGATPSHVAWFLHAARRLGLGTTVVRWGFGDPAAAAAAVARSGVDGVFVAKGFPEAAGPLIRALRARLGARLPIIGTDFLFPPPALSQSAGAAADGTYVSLAGVPNDRLPPAGLRFLRAFGTQTPSYGAAYAAQAAAVLLAAIARSDGTRASVVRELHRTNVRGGILGDLRFTVRGDPVTAPVTILRVVRRGGERDPFLRGAAVVRVITPPPRVIP